MYLLCVGRKHILTLTSASQITALIAVESTFDQAEVLVVGTEMSSNLLIIVDSNIYLRTLLVTSKYTIGQSSKAFLS